LHAAVNNQRLQVSRQLSDVNFPGKQRGLASRVLVLNSELQLLEIGDLAPVLLVPFVPDEATRLAGDELPRTGTCDRWLRQTGAVSDLLPVRLAEDSAPGVCGEEQPAIVGDVGAVNVDHDFPIVDDLD